MSIMILQVFVSLMLVVGSIVLLAFSIKSNDHEHADRLSLLPFEKEKSADHDASRSGPRETQDD